MLRAVAWIVAGVLVVAAQAATAGETEAYDDRVAFKRAVDLIVKLYDVTPGARECAAQAAKFRQDPIKGHIAELQSLSRTLRAASKADGTDQVRQMRVGFAQKIAALTQTFSAYGVSANSYASVKTQVKQMEKTKPKC
jgi:hypothetical protein